MIIDNTFFHSKLLIPNINDKGIGGKSNNIDRLIEEECYSFLNSLLGNEIYNDLEQYFDEDLNLIDEAPQKYKDLFFGKKYNDKNWRGLIIEKKLGNYSLLADYVWLKWYENTITLTSTNGEVVINSKNASRVNPTEKYLEIWNELVRKVGGTLTNNEPIVTFKQCIKVTDWYGGNIGNTTLSEFLYDHRDEFPNPTLRLPNGQPLVIKNIFGL